MTATIDREDLNRYYLATWLRYILSHNSAASVPLHYVEQLDAAHAALVYEHPQYGQRILTTREGDALLAWAAQFEVLHPWLTRR